MTRVYAIHTGSYSDQSWGPIFSTVERALAYQAKRKDSEMSIEVHVLDDENDSGPVYPSWRLVFDNAGDVLFSEKFDPVPYEPKLHKVEVVVVPPNNRWYIVDKIVPRSRAHLLISEVYAPDLNHAIKIAADARTRFLAQGTSQLRRE